MNTPWDPIDTLVYTLRTHDIGLAQGPRAFNLAVRETSLTCYADVRATLLRQDMLEVVSRAIVGCARAFVPRNRRGYRVQVGMGCRVSVVGCRVSGVGVGGRVSGMFFFNVFPGGGMDLSRCWYHTRSCNFVL